jgi:hypothetical protein
MRRPIYPLIVGLFIPFTAFSQMLERSVMNSFGNVVTVSGLYLEQNGGEVLTQSLNASGTWLLQGFLQPSKESVSLEFPPQPTPDCPTPAPVPFSMILELKNNTQAWHTASLFDANGRLIWITKNPSNTLTGIPADIAEGVYFLELRSSYDRACRYKLLHIRD